MVQVVRCFDDADVHHVSGTVDPVRDIEVINTELMLADLESVRKRREKVGKDVKRGDKAAAAEDVVLAKIEATLDAGKPALSADLSPEERDTARSFFLLSDKPTIFACNVAEAGHGDRGHEPARAEGPRLRPHPPGLRGRRHQRADRERPGRPLTGGSRGVPRAPGREGKRDGRADPLDLPPARAADLFHRRGEGGPRLDHPRGGHGAAGGGGDSLRLRARVHQGGDRLVRRSGACGSVAAARDKGLYRMEGKEYVVADGDVLLFKFNV